MEGIKIRLGKGIEEMREQMEGMMELLHHHGRCFAPSSGTFWAPPMDIYETPQEIIVLVELAGLREDAIQVTMDQGILRISGVRSNPIQEAHRRVLQMEIEIGPFERRIRIRVPVDVAGIQALYKEGFLTIRLPRAAEDARGVHVDVVTS